MNFTVLTLFPELVSAFFDHGMILRGIEKELITGACINIRDFAQDRHKTVDDKPYGGGSGMIMKPETLQAAIVHAKKNQPDSKVILMSPQGKRFDQKTAGDMASKKQGLIFVCGRYEGIDERICTSLIDEEISIGDYVLTGGELAAMTLIDSIARLIPGVLGSCESSKSDSFSGHRLEYAQYTRPEVFEDMEVPPILLSGNHEKIRYWRKRSALQRTFLKRPDLFDKTPLRDEEKQILKHWCRELEKLSENNLYVALIHFPVMNRKGQPIGSSLTTIDMHDIARASITFGVKGFFVVTPYEDQATIAHQVVEHWTKGVGGVLNPFRKNALELIHVTRTVEDVVAWLEKNNKKPVVTIATSAKKIPGSVDTECLRQILENDASHVLFFGTAWGLAEELIKNCDYVLDPIYGNTPYNHLSVRSAASIYLDRIINGR